MRRHREIPRSWCLSSSLFPGTIYFGFHCNILQQMKTQRAQTGQVHSWSTSLCSMINIVQTHNKVTLSMYFSKILLYGNVLSLDFISPLPPSPLPPSPSHRHIFNRIMSQAVFVLVVLLGISVEVDGVHLHIDFVCCILCIVYSFIVVSSSCKQQRALSERVTDLFETSLWSSGRGAFTNGFCLHIMYSFIVESSFC
jgi:hypothetical protein